MLNTGMSLVPLCCLFVGVADSAQHRFAQGTAGELHGVGQTVARDAARERQSRRSRKTVWERERGERLQLSKRLRTVLIPFRHRTVLQPGADFVRRTPRWT